MKRITAHNRPTTLKRLMCNIWQVTTDIDLIFSEDDHANSGKGWYLQSTKGTCKTLSGKSISFETYEKALKALKNNTITF